MGMVFDQSIQPEFEDVQLLNIGIVFSDKVECLGDVFSSLVWHPAYQLDLGPDAEMIGFFQNPRNSGGHLLPGEPGHLGAHGFETEDETHRSGSSQLSE